MTIQPSDLEQVQIPRRLRGYDVNAVDQLLDDLEASFKQVWEERAKLQKSIRELEADRGAHREREQVLSDVLVTAEQAAEQLAAEAREEAKRIVNEAWEEARQVRAEAQGRARGLETEVERLTALRKELYASYRVLLHAALCRIDAEMSAETETDQRTLLEDLRVKGGSAAAEVTPEISGAGRESEPSDA